MIRTVPRAEPWDVVVEASDELATRLLDEGYSPELGDTIEQLMLMLQASGRITNRFSSRQRLSTTMRFWASILGIERGGHVVAPVLAEPVAASGLPPISPDDARELLRGGNQVRERDLRGYVDDSKNGRPVSSDRYSLWNCRVIRGRIERLRLTDVFEISRSSVIDFEVNDLETDELKASSIRMMGGSIRALEVRGTAKFHRAVIRSARIEHCVFGSADFSQSKLGVSQFDPDGTVDFEDLLPTLVSLGFRQGTPVVFDDVQFGNATFENAELDGVTFSNCALRNVDFSKVRSIFGARFVNGCKLQGAKFDGAPGDATVEIDESSSEGVDLASLVRRGEGAA